MRSYLDQNKPLLRRRFNSTVQSPVFEKQAPPSVISHDRLDRHLFKLAKWKSQLQNMVGLS